MSFLAPLFLLGTLAVALPVIFHLIRRTTRERTVFSSIMFLLPSPPRLTRRSRLEHILLLLLRCAVLCLLALGFARPYFRKAVSSPDPSAGKRIVLLLDTSASMRRANLWSDAREKVEAVLGRTAPGDQVALFGFDRQVTPLVNFDQWNAAPLTERAALVKGKLNDISPGWSATHLGNALISAAESLSDLGGKRAPAPGQIILISDLQEGSHLDPLQGYEWPKGVELSVEPLKARHPSNASLQLVADALDSESKVADGVRVRVTNAADSKREQFQVGWARGGRDAFTAAPSQLYVPAGQSRILSLPVPPAETEPDSIVLRGDDEDFDNTVYVVPPVPAKLNILYFGGEPESDPKQPLYFLERAFQKTRRQSVQVLARPPGTILQASDLQSATFFVLSDALPEASLQVLHDQAANGKTLLFVLRSAAGAPALARLLDLPRLGVEEAHATGNSYTMLAEIDFRHPVFAPFADPRFSDFTKIHFWRHRRLDPAGIPGARVLAKFESGDPALLEIPVGKGRVLVLTSGWHPEDSQLALSTKFVPLLYSLLEYSGAPPAQPVQYHVGDVIPVWPDGQTATPPLSITTPDGSQITLSAQETNFSTTLFPGIYKIEGKQPGQASKFAINLDATESRTAALSLDDLQRLGAPLSRQMPAAVREADRKVRLQNAELEGRQKLWRWFILGTMAVLLIETWLAGRAVRRPTQPVAAT